MMKLLPLFFLFTFFGVWSQERPELRERFPVFDECKEVAYGQEETCFKRTLREKISEKFELPEVVAQAHYKGEIIVLFEVDAFGKFKIIYVDAVYAELREELKRVFKELPKIKPGTYNGRAISLQFRIVLPVPLNSASAPSLHKESIVEDSLQKPEKKSPFNEYDAIVSKKYKAPRAESRINIPLSHELYRRFDAELNHIGTNFHTGSKPFLYHEVQPYYDFSEELQKLNKPANSWFGRKLWNEHLFAFQGKGYWFTADFALDLQVGKDFGSKLDVTYNNTRTAILQGGLGEKFNFYTVIYENQGRFSDYYNRYAESIRPDGGDPAIIPGRGIAKPFMGQAYDYPVATGYISFSPNKYFNLQLGHGKNFIGDGYRSLLMSDNASPYPYFKLTTTFWKIKYTNTWMSLRDVRPQVTGDGSFRTKYMANHYLSYNITKRLNIGLFESVMWENDNNRGFDLNYLNPVIFYRAIEFSTGARAGNAIIGITGKYKWSDQFNTYGQLIIDEFSSGDIFGGEKSWKNKLGFQLGLKYYQAFNIPNLSIQLEYNQVRPYTYSHNTVVLNYGHNNQSMAHPWGANFRELLGIARYKTGRYYGHVKLSYGMRGKDFNTLYDQNAYGGDIYRSEVDRPFETGVEIGQGNTTHSFFAQSEVGYIVNPKTNLKLYTSLIYRSFNPEIETNTVFNDNTIWLNIGLRTDIFNWYYNY